MPIDPIAHYLAAAKSDTEKNWEVCLNVLIRTVLMLAVLMGGQKPSPTRKGFLSRRSPWSNWSQSSWGSVSWSGAIDWRWAAAAVHTSCGRGTQQPWLRYTPAVAPVLWRMALSSHAPRWVATYNKSLKVAVSLIDYVIVECFESCSRLQCVPGPEGLSGRLSEIVLFA